MKPGPYFIPGLLGVAAIVVVGVLFARPEPAPFPETISQETFERAAVFSGQEYRVTSVGLERGKATAVFGGLEVDLRDAEIMGDIAVIEVAAVFGGVDLRVPGDWIVESDVGVFIGGIDNRARAPAVEGAKRLIVRGGVVFGGLDIRN